MNSPLFDFTMALARTIDAVCASGRLPTALSMPERRREQLSAVLSKHSGLGALATNYRGLPIHTALSMQQTVAVIDDLGRAHLV